MKNNQVQALKDGRVFIDHGPVSMVIFASKGNKVLTNLCMESFSIVEETLSVLAKDLPLLENFPMESTLPYLSGISKQMLETVLCVGEPTLTPMATVAGTMSDMVADWLEAQGATKVIVNNGGDIALRLKDEEKVRMGILSDLQLGTMSEVVTIYAKDGIGGVCTSGLGGRSFTRGIASAVTVFSKRCMIADACATHIANTSYIQSPRVFTQKAGELKPNSDIANLKIVTRVDCLEEAEIGKGIKQMRAECEVQQKKGNVIGVVAEIQGRTTYFPEDIALFRRSREGARI